MNKSIALFTIFALIAVACAAPGLIAPVLHGGLIGPHLGYGYGLGVGHHIGLGYGLHGYGLGHGLGVGHLGHGIGLLGHGAIIGK